MGAKEGLGWMIVRYYPIHIMKLQILETELDSLTVRVRLFVLTQPQAEEEGDMYEVGRALGKGAGDVGRIYRGCDEA